MFFARFLSLSLFLRLAGRFFARRASLLTACRLQKTPEIIPSDVTEFFLRKSGFACEDPVVIKMVSLAAQKFVTDLAKVGPGPVFAPFGMFGLFCAVGSDGFGRSRMPLAKSARGSRDRRSRRTGGPCSCSKTWPRRRANSAFPSPSPSISPTRPRRAWPTRRPARREAAKNAHCRRRRAAEAAKRRKTSRAPPHGQCADGWTGKEMMQ